jgi:hypothetical protein
MAFGSLGTRDGPIAYTCLPRRPQNNLPNLGTRALMNAARTCEARGLMGARHAEAQRRREHVVALNFSSFEQAVAARCACLLEGRLRAAVSSKRRSPPSAGPAHGNPRLGQRCVHVHLIPFRDRPEAVRYVPDRHRPAIRRADHTERVARPAVRHLSGFRRAPLWPGSSCSFASLAPLWPFFPSRPGSPVGVGFSRGALTRSRWPSMTVALRFRFPRRLHSGPPKNL